MNAMKYILKLRDGYLLGQEYEGAPCRHCVSLWLRDRVVSHEFIDVAELPIKRELLEQLECGLFFEVSSESDAPETRLECHLEKHPDCACNGQTFEYDSKKLNYVFSSIFGLKCTRFGTPQGNIWVAQATHTSGTTRHGVSTERETARRNAVEAIHNSPSTLELVKNEVVSRYSAMVKTPMLIVGDANWLRQNVPFFLTQQFDVHLFFYPNANSAWVIGAVAFSRLNPKATPIWSYGCNQSIDKAVTQAVHGLLPLTQGELPEQHEKLNTWLQLWVYRCPKISLKDVLSLETYDPKGLEEFKPSATRVMHPIFRVIIGGGESLQKAG